MANSKSLNLEPIIKDIAYEKELTMTSTEIMQAINEALLGVGFEFVSTLPTGNDIEEKMYIVPNTSGESNAMATVWVYDFENNQWNDIDSLNLDIDLVSGKEDASNKVTIISNESTNTQYPSAKLVYDQLELKANVSHTHTASQMADTTAYSNLGTSANATQAQINAAINTKLGQAIDYINQ